MLVLFVLLPCLVIGAAAVVVLDRMGVLSGFESGRAATRSDDGSLLERVPRAALVAGMGLLGVWILAWVVLLFVGLNVLGA